MPKFVARSSRRPSQNRPQVARTRRQSFFETLEDRSLMATLYWQGDVSNAWSALGNWTTNPAVDTPPLAAPASGDTLNFDTTVVNFNTGAAQGYTPNNDIGGISSLTVNINDAGAANDFTLSGVLTGLSVGGVSSNVSNGAGATISMPLLLASSIFNTAGAPLTVSGAISGTSLLKTGAGTLILSNANNYTAGSTINQGTLQITNATATGTGATTVNGGVFEINNVAHNGPLTLNTGATVRGLGTGASEAGAITVASGANVTFATGVASDVLTLTSILTNAGGSAATPTVNISGPGIVSVQGNSTAFRGLWNVQSGALRVTSSGSFGVSTVSGTLVGSTLTMSGGNLIVRSDSALTFNGGGATALPVILAANATFTQQRVTAGTGLVDAFGTFSMGGFIWSTTYDQATVTGGDAAFDFNGLVTLTGNATINTIRPIAGTRSLPRFNAGITDGGVTRTLTLNNNGPNNTEEAIVIAGARSFLATSQLDFTGSQPLRVVLQTLSATDNARIRFANTGGNILDLRSDTAGTFNNTLFLDASGELRQSRINTGNALTYGFGAITFNTAASLLVAGNGNLTANTAYQFNVPSITLGGNATININNNGTGVGTLNVTGPVSETGGSRTLTKGGAGTLALNATSTYTGATTVGQGTVNAGADNIFANNTLTMGSGANVAAINFGNFNQTITGLNVVSNSTSNNTLTTGGSLTINGGVTVGVSPSDNTNNTNTRLVASGAGSITVLAGANNLIVGVPVSTTTNNTSNSATLDLSGLGGFSYIATTGVVRVGVDNGTGSTQGTPNPNILALSNVTNTITTPTITIGDNIHAINNNTLRLGTGTNNINAGAINLGAQAGRRGGGNIIFNAPGGAGTTTIRGQNGSGASLLTMGVNSTNTGAAIADVVDLTGHLVDAVFSAVTMGASSGAANTNGATTYTHSLAFDTGILTITGALTIGQKTGAAANAPQTNSVTIGGGTVNIGSVSIGTHTSTGGSIDGTLHINGGTTTVAGAITVGGASAGGGISTGILNLNGGTLQVAGNVQLGSTVGTESGTVNFNGGVLRAGANNPTWLQGLTAANVQAGGAIIDSNGFNVTIAQQLLDAGGGLTKQGAGTLTLTAANQYSGATNVNAGTLALQGGAAILDTAGAVNVGLGGTLQLNTSETVSSYNGAGDIGVGTNDSTLALGANTLTTTGNAAIANVTTTTGGGIIAGGSITDTDDDNNITGTNIYLQAASGIGTAADPIETAVAAIQTNNTTAGDINIRNSNAGALLTVSDLRTLGFGSNNPAGATTIVNGSPLTIAANVISAGPVVLTAVDSAAAGDNLTINGGVLVQSTGSSVTLNAGDAATVTGNVTSATTTTINVDATSGGVADPGVGGSLNITGVITTPTVGAGGGTFLNGFTDDDTFTFNPQTTTEFRLFGDAPTGTNTGDTLVMNVAGTTNPTLTIPGTIPPYTGLGSGSWSFTSAHRPVLFSSIEVSNITGQHHVIYDNSISPVANLVVMRDSALPTANVQLRSGTNAGPIVYQGTMSQILSLTINGSAGNDMVTVDDINTLPDFAGTVPGVTDNANLAGTAELLFDGLGGTNTLVYNINGTNAAQSYAVGNGTGAGGSEGEVQSTAAGVTLQTYFQNVGLVQRTGAGASPQGLTVIGDASANAFTIAGNGALTRTAAAGYTPFEFSGNNYSAVTINALAGTDSLDLVNLGTGQTNNPAFNLNGGTEDDTLRVRSTTGAVGNTGLVSLNGGAGNDLFQLFDAGNTVDNITGPVDVDGVDGNVGGNTDTLVIVDSGDLTGDPNVVIGAVNAGLSADYFVDGINGVVSSDVVLRNIDTLDYTGTSGNDTVDGRFVNTSPAHDLTTVSLSGWLGGDLFRLLTSDQIGGTGPNNTPTGVASGVATINLYGDAPGNPNPSDGTDTFGDTPAGVTPTGATNVGLVVSSDTRMIRPSASTAITIDGGRPTGLAAPAGDVLGDTLNVNISDLPNTTPVVVSTFGPGTVVAPGISPLVWSEIEDINVVDQNKLTNVQMGDLFARTTPSPDLVQITRNPTLTNPNQVRLRITATIGNYSVSNKTIIYGGGMNDTITQSNLTVPAEFYGEDGDDYLTGAMNNDWLVGGLGSDRINGSGGDNVIWGDNSPTNPGDLTPQDSAVGGNDQLSALGGNDVFYGGGGNDTVSGGAGNDYAYGGQGSDTLDGNDGDDRLYGGAGNDTLSGHAGNDLLSGGDGDDKLYGATGNDVLFGGFGVDSIDGGAGNDLLVTGSVVNENSSWTSSPNTTTFSPATYSLGADNDAALLVLLNQWSATSDRSSIAAIIHDGLNDDVFGSTEDDDFCWEAADVVENFPGTTPPDFNAVGMGSDERFGPT